MSVNGQPCKWWKHLEVVTQLRSMGEEGVSLQVVSLLPSPEPRGTVSTWPGARAPTLSLTQPWSFPPCVRVLREKVARQPSLGVTFRTMVTSDGTSIVWLLSCSR